jgi:hypothetical protein
MDELQRLVAYSDKHSWFSVPNHFCGYRELHDDGSLGRAILWHSLRKEAFWFKLVTEQWYPLLNRLHFGNKTHSETPDSEPTFSKCSEGTLACSAQPYLLANVGGYGHDDGIYLLDSSHYRHTKNVSKSRTSPDQCHVNKTCSSKNIQDRDVYQLHDIAVDHWLNRVRKKGSIDDKDFAMAKTICKYRQTVMPMTKTRNEYLLSLRLSPEKYIITSAC